MGVRAGVGIRCNVWGVQVRVGVCVIIKEIYYEQIVCLIFSSQLPSP